jgi:chromosome segregation ATPase
MQNSNNSASLSIALKEWFDALKPLYGSLNTFIKHGKLSSEDSNNLITLMKDASIACQKVSDTEFELQNISDKMDNLISNLEKQKNEKSEQISELDNNKNHNEEDLNNIKLKITELSGQLQQIIEKIDTLSDEHENLTTELENKKEEDYELELLINEKNITLKDLNSKISEREAEFQKFTNGFNDDIAREDIIEEKDRYKYAKAKVEIMEMLVSKLAKEAPQLDTVWNYLSDIIYTYDIDLIHEKIRGIKDVVASLDFSQVHSVNQESGMIEAKEIITPAVEPDKIAEIETEKQNMTAEVDKLLQSVALLNIESQSKKRKSDELSSRIEEKNYALQKMEQYYQELKNNISSFEKEYGKLSETFSLLNKSEGLNESLNHFSHFNREFYFDEYYNKLQDFYKENKERIDSDISESYEKLRNIEKLISLKQKELNIIEERINKEYPNYELKIANLQLRMQRKDKDIEILNSSISENNEKITKMDSEIISIKAERKLLDDEKSNLTNKISELEADIRSKIEEIQSLNYSIKDSGLKIKQFEDQNKLLCEELSNQSSKSQGYELLVNDYKARLDNGNEEISGLKLKLEELESSISVYTEKLTYAEEMALQKEDEITLAKVSAKKTEESNIELIDENENYRKEIKRIQALLDEKTSEEERLRQELSILSRRKNEGEKAILELEKVNTSLASQIRRRENLLEEMEGENKTLKEKIKEISETVK